MPYVMSYVRLRLTTGIKRTWWWWQAYRLLWMS